MYGNYCLKDATGKELQHGKANGNYQIKIETETLSKGMYYFIFKSDNKGVISHKVIKQ